MYTDLVLDLTIGDKFVLENDRALYSVFLETTEEYMRGKRNVLLGGVQGMRLLNDENTLTRDSYQWDIYADDAWAVVRDLGKLISQSKSPHIPADTTEIQTVIPRKEYNINVFCRTILKVYSMPWYRGKPLSEIIPLVEKKGFFVSAVESDKYQLIRVMPPVLQLVEIYRCLYLPNKFETWSEMLHREATFREIFGAADFEDQKNQEDLKEDPEEDPEENQKDNEEHMCSHFDLDDSSSDEITGGRQKHRDGKHKKQHSDQTSNHNLLIEKIPGVLIGDYAFLDATEFNNHARIQFLSAQPIEDSVTIIKKIFGTAVVVREYNTHIPVDFQLIKHTIYVNDKAICDIYNSPQYELIPYRQVGERKLANWFVVLRFLFIDIWLMRLIGNIASSAQAAGSRQTDLSKKIKLAQSHVDKMLDKNPTELFQLSNYEGKYIDEKIAKKKIALLQPRMAPIFPAKVAK